MWIAIACWAAMGWGGVADQGRRVGTEIKGSGWVIDSSHPGKPGDTRQIGVAVRAVIDQDLGEAVLELGDLTGARGPAQVHYFRQGRLFQLDEAKAIIPSDSFGDLSSPTIATLQPRLVEMALKDRPESAAAAEPGGAGRSVHFAWNNELWTVRGTAGDAKSPLGLRRSVRHDLYGDGIEEISYEGRKTVVKLRGRVIASIEWEVESKEPASLSMPAIDPRYDRERLIQPEEMKIRALADPRLFALESTTTNSRVFVAEFADHLVVFEGAFNARNCEAIGRALRARFDKPVRYFAFSHIHGQYVGSVRAWVHEGAAVLAPPGTEPLVRELVKAPFGMRPDALAREPRELRFEAVPEKWTHVDGTNEMVIYNTKKSEHTDEYFLVHFPRTGVVLTGDLLFYRPGKPFAGRSAKLCEVLAELEITVKMAYPSWPLEMAGVKNVVTGEEFYRACEAKPEPPANNEAKPAEKPK